MLAACRAGCVGARQAATCAIDVVIHLLEACDESLNHWILLMSFDPRKVCVGGRGRQRLRGTSVKLADTMPLLPLAAKVVWLMRANAGGKLDSL